MQDRDSNDPVCNKLNYIDLFSGIGGFALGAYWAGMHFENHYFSEVEPYAVDLYQQRFPDAIPLGDITKHKEWELEQGEYIITGGFPCQDISAAGKGTGIRGSRSGLWFEMHRIIRDLRPRFAIMENVGALTFRGLTDVLGSLAEIGYDAEWQDIRAEDVGAPHRRERIWIVAYPTGAGIWGDCGHVRKEDGRPYGQVCGQLERSSEEPQNVAYPGLPESQGRNADEAGADRPRRESCAELTSYSTEMADASRELLNGSGEPWYGRRQSANGSGEVSDAAGERPQEREGTKGQRTHPPIARGDRWATEPAVCGVADGLPPELYKHKRKHHLLYEGRLSKGQPKRVDRLRGLGNAIVPQIAEILFRQIATKRFR